MHGEPLQHEAWHARLALEYERRGERTVLAARRHDGPLVVQKPLYPEGDAVCHTIVVHPPAGIVGGDELAVTVRTAAAAQTLLTTPGAGKWYRSAGPWARQRLDFDIADGACLEWLPQETIVFDGALADLCTDVQLGPRGRFIGWEILCLGRTGSGERFGSGCCRLHMTISRAGKPQWLERGDIHGGGDMLAATAALASQPVTATLLAAAPGLDRALLDACRSVQPQAGESGVTLLPDVLVARYLGASSEAAKNYFTALWRVLRPVVTGREAVEPRIWRT
jgi:urease accessory protein